MTDATAQKRLVGLAAADEVESGMVLGLGSGTTVYFFLEELGRRVRAGLRVAGIPTSRQTAELATEFGIPLTTFELHQELDLDVDGADEVDSQLNLIKGHGGALLREKIIARVSKRCLIIVDERKLSPTLGCQSSLPVEVLPFACPLAARELGRFGAVPELRHAPDGQPFVTDNGNWIVDCTFHALDEPAAAEARIERIPGVMASGLFVGLASEVLVAGDATVRRLVR